MKQFVSSSCLVVTLIACPLIHGQVLPYLNEDSFNAATTTTTLTFEGLDTSNGNPGYTIFSGLSDSGLSFSNSSALYAVTTGFGENYNDSGTSLALDGSKDTTLTLPSNVTAVGGQFFTGTANAADGIFDIFLAGNTTSTPDATYDITVNPIDNSQPTTFFGVTSSGASISKIVFEANNRSTGVLEPAVDNLEFGTLDPVLVPEPSTAITMVVGFFGLLFVQRRLRTAGITK